MGAGLELSGTIVILVHRRSLGGTSDEVGMMWPVGWRLPQAGDAVHLKNDLGGFVEYVDMWPTTGRVRVYLR